MYLSLILNVILRFYLPQKKTSELSFCSRFKMYVLMVSILPFAVKIIRLITSPAVKKVSFPQSRNSSPVKKLFHNKGPFPQSRYFSSRENFPQSRKFSTKTIYLIKGIFHKQWSFLQSRKFPTKNFFWSNKFSTNKEVFHKIFFLDQESFPQTKTFCKQRLKRFSKSLNYGPIQY